MRIEPWGSKARIEPHPGRVFVGGFSAPLAAAAAIAAAMSGGSDVFKLIGVGMVLAVPLGLICAPLSLVLCALLVRRMAPRLIYACAAGGVLGLLPLPLVTASGASASEPPLSLLKELVVFFVAPGALGGAVFWLIVVPGAPETGQRTNGRA